MHSFPNQISILIIQHVRIVATHAHATRADFNVFVGQVGYWLPFNPCADKVEDEHFINSQLNDMMEKYKENTINKDLFYEEQKRDKVKAAREEVLRKKREEAEQKKQEEEENMLKDKEEEVPKFIKNKIRSA